MKFKAIRELFHFTQKERYGIIALLCLIFILISINISLPYFINNKVVDTSKWENEVNEFLSHQNQQGQSVKPNGIVPFDPNRVTFNELTQLGLPIKVASNWIRYLGKGGRFKKKEDVGKIYGMTSVLFDQIDKFILLPKEVKYNQPRTKQDAAINRNFDKRKNDVIFERSILRNNVFELNKADSASLVKLPGIGPVLASRIIRYRNLLGGYYSVNQLHEVYGLREEHFTSASPHLNVEDEQYRKFNINFATLLELGRHPYIGFKAARKIVKVRDERGKYVSVEDLTGIIAGDSLKKLIPYLTFNVKEE